MTRFPIDVHRRLIDEFPLIYDPSFGIATT